MPTAIIVMAAGASRRMGRPKQTLPFGSSTMLRHAVEAALSSRASTVVVVIGFEAEAMGRELAGLPIQIAVNPDWDAGMGTSIRTGVQTIRQHPGIDSLILTVADSPGLTPETYNRIMAAHVASGLPIVASQYSGTLGVPALFAQQFFEALLALTPDQGCKAIMLGNAAKAMRLPCPEAAADIDTPEDYQELSSGLKNAD